MGYLSFLRKQESNKMETILKLKNILKQKNLDALLVSSVPNIIYLTGFNGFSTEEREAFLLITTKDSFLFTDTRYSEAVRTQIPFVELVARKQGEKLKDQLQDILTKEKVKQIGFEEKNISVFEYKRLFRFDDSNHRSILIPADNLIDQMRVTKDSQEIEAIEKACKAGDETFKHILNKIKTGVSEKELAFEIEKYIKQSGTDISFDPIVAFSQNSAIPHHKPNDQRLKA